MDEALQSTCEAEQISSYFLDKVKGTKRSRELRKVTKQGIKPRSPSSQSPGLIAKYSRLAASVSCHRGFVPVLSLEDDEAVRQSHYYVVA